MSENWPLYIPVLVTLVEDPDTKVRSRGLAILTVFLSKFPNKTLAQTGLGDVFTEAVIPTLSYLPSLTPPGESVQLLGPAYVALLVLSRKLFPNHRHSKEKGQYLDKFLREGIFTSSDHAKEHFNIVEVLVEASSSIVDEMGIYSVKHLRVSSATHRLTFKPTACLFALQNHSNMPTNTSSHPKKKKKKKVPLFDLLQHPYRPFRSCPPAYRPRCHQGPTASPEQLLAAHD